MPSHGKLFPDDKRGAAHFWDEITTKLRKDANDRQTATAAPKKKAIAKTRSNAAASKKKASKRKSAP